MIGSPSFFDLEVFMKKIILPSIASLVLLIAFNNSALASLLGTFSDRHYNSSLAAEPNQNVKFELTYCSQSDVSDQSGMLLRPENWTGWVPMIDVTLNSSTYTDGETWRYGIENKGFLDNSEILTNGNNDVLAFRSGDSSGYKGYGFFREGAFWENYNGTNRIDFAGYNIDMITFTLDKITPDEDPGALFYTINIFGDPDTPQTPVPSTLLLLGSGFLGIFGIRSRMKQ
jgi:hypothetical protein